MKRLSIIMSIVGLAAFIGFASVANAYEWHYYNGHLYTVTNDWSTWEAAEQEAVNLGGHLVTINDEGENTWLTNTFKDTYDRCYTGQPWQNIAWIGYYYDAGSNSWKWINGEPVTYYAYAPNWPVGGIYAYLLLAYHPWSGLWGDNPYHNESYCANAKGIIEVPIVITVVIDIKPGSFPNTINLESKGNIPVAILSDPTFDATTVDRSTVVFAGASPLPIGKTPEDVNGDGLLDVVFHFGTQKLNLQIGDTKACLSGKTFSGQNFADCDSVLIVK